VHISSFSVYDFSTIPTNHDCDENNNIEAKPEARDAYTITKMIQERLVTETCTNAGTEFIVLRPGAIYGPGKDWNFGRAVSFGSFDLIFSPNTIFRLTYVDNCADAIVKAIEARALPDAVINIVDDELPTFREFYEGCRRAGASTGRPIPVPWFLVSALGRSIRFLNQFAFRNRAKLPEILEYRRQQARWKPLRYNNKLARTALNWSPKVGLQEGISLMLRSEDGAISS
jgi:nucleoside-diphosphate-sugar epimerase